MGGMLGAAVGAVIGLYAQLGVMALGALAALAMVQGITGGMTR